MPKKTPKTTSEDHKNLSGLPENKLYRISEVAQIFKVHERTIRLWIAHGKLIAEKPAGIIYITSQSIQDFRLAGQKYPLQI